MFIYISILLDAIKGNTGEGNGGNGEESKGNYIQANTLFPFGVSH